jgi:hypothetical protein
MDEIEKMTFSQALEKAKSGEKVCRKIWENAYVYAYNCSGDYEKRKYKKPYLVIGVVDMVEPYTPSQSDMFASDWIIFDYSMLKNIVLCVEVISKNEFERGVHNG